MNIDLDFENIPTHKYNMYDDIAIRYSEYSLEDNSMDEIKAIIDHQISEILFPDIHDYHLIDVKLEKFIYHKNNEKPSKIKASYVFGKWKD